MRVWGVLTLICIPKVSDNKNDSTKMQLIFEICRIEPRDKDSDTPSPTDRVVRESQQGLLIPDWVFEALTSSKYKWRGREGGKEKFKPSSCSELWYTPCTSHGHAWVKETFRNKKLFLKPFSGSDNEIFYPEAWSWFSSIAGTKRCPNYPDWTEAVDLSDLPSERNLIIKANKFGIRCQN